MIVLGNREQEIISRATNRTVTAIFYLSAPDVDAGIAPEKFGMLYDRAKPVHPPTGPTIVAQASQFWKMDDTCDPLISRDLSARVMIMDAVARRTHALTQGEMAQLHTNRKITPFDCADLVDKATGIPPRISLDFKKSKEVFEADLAHLPFPKLKGVLTAIYEKVQAIGGTLHGADIAHGASMSAYEYYEVDINKHVRGFKLSYGDIMLAKASRLLQDIGIPRIEPPKPSSSPH